MYILELQSEFKQKLVAVIFSVTFKLPNQSASPVKFPSVNVLVPRSIFVTKRLSKRLVVLPKSFKLLIGMIPSLSIINSNIPPPVLSWRLELQISKLIGFELNILPALNSKYLFPY